MAQFIKIRETRINAARINYYTVSKLGEEYSLFIVFGQADDICFRTKDKHELENWLKALGEKQ